jgi:cytochrome c peroxidase
MVKRLSLASSGLMLMFAGCGTGGGGTDDSTVSATLAVEATASATAVLTSELEPASNTAGIAATVTTSGVLDFTNSFFQPLGTNPRSCDTCHDDQQGWTISARGTTKLFFQTQGLDPLFNPLDEGSRPDADLSTEASRLAAFGPTLLRKGLTRFTRTNPATSEFNVTAVADPSGFSTTTSFINFRRPTPTQNEALVSSVTNTAGPGLVPAALAALVRGAANFHEQRDPTTPVPDDVVANQVAFQLGLFFAQTIDNDAGRLDADGATGGPTNLMAQPFHIGINDIQGLDPAGQPFSPKVFNLFDAWAVYNQDCNHDHDHARSCPAGSADDDAHRHRVAAARAAIYRGQQLFNNRQFNISGVNGLNNLLGQSTVAGTCSTCHNAPNVGGHSVVRMFDVGTADQINCGLQLPLVTVQNKTTNETRSVCDLGRASGSHLWAEIGTFRAPPLRGLAARPPYFHDGQAARIEDVVSYFDRRFQIGFSGAEKSDLVAFLRAL